LANIVGELIRGRPIARTPSIPGCIDACLAVRSTSSTAACQESAGGGFRAGHLAGRIDPASLPQADHAVRRHAIGESRLESMYANG
jgi:hypothetical protein